MDYGTVVDRLITRQLRDWDLAGANYEALARVMTRTLQVGQSAVVLQYNPGRRQSSSASLDKQSLARRKCFLCTEHQPARQKAVLWGDRYKIQVNPYPIFERHLTIADLHHVPQSLAGRVGDMLQLARDLPGYVVFYNGPLCGASAPDHAHFQAGVKGGMPLCDEVLHATTHLLADGDEGFIGYVDTLARVFFTIETATRRAAERYALRLLSLLPVAAGSAEPMVNVLCWWDETDHTWRMAIVPRRKHRPACYGQGEEHLLLSPGATEMGGLWAVPERKDYDALTPDMIQALYNELCMTRQDLIPVITGFDHHWEDLQPI